MEFLALISENIQAISVWLKIFGFLVPSLIIGIVIMILFYSDFSRWKGSESRRRLEGNFQEYDDLELSGHLFKP